MRNLLIAVAAGLLITGCGTVSGCACSGGVGATPSASPGLGFDATVTETTKAASLRVGQKLEVVLHAAAAAATWTQPKSSDESILAPIVNPAATAVRGVTLAAFEARSPGEVDITAYAAPVCPSGQACPMYVMVFSAKVTVTQ
jgi:hypothetical protein